MSNLPVCAHTHQQIFAERVLPIVERHARIVFRFTRRRGDDYADAIADCVAYAWQAYIFAVRRGKQPWRFPNMLATFAAQRTKCGRKVGKRMQAKDVYSAARTQRVQLDYLADEPNWQEAVEDDTETPVAEQAAFRIDFAAWLETLSPRDREIAETLAVGHSATDVAQRFALSCTRVTQIRQELMAEWERYTA